VELGAFDEEFVERGLEAPLADVAVMRVVRHVASRPAA